MHNLRSFSVDMTTGECHYGARLTRNHPEQYVHVLVPGHEIARFEALRMPRAKSFQARVATAAA
jgi:hypothetical protein